MAEGGGLLNRYTLSSPIRVRNPLRLRQPLRSADVSNCRSFAPPRTARSGIAVRLERRAKNSRPASSHDTGRNCGADFVLVAAADRRVEDPSPHLARPCVLVGRVEAGRERRRRSPGSSRDSTRSPPCRGRTPRRWGVRSPRASRDRRRMRRRRRARRVGHRPRSGRGGSFRVRLGLQFVDDRLGVPARPSDDGELEAVACRPRPRRAAAPIRGIKAGGPCEARSC